MAAPSTDSKSRGRSSGRATSLSGGKVRSAPRAHGSKRSDGDSVSRGGGARSKSRDRRGGKRMEYDTPFDDKGRCHYHKNVQLAAKKMTGGWKVLHTLCPKCMEEKHDSVKERGDDSSVRSGRSARSAKSAAAGGGDGNGKYDKNGCCVVHSHIQVAKKKMLGGGWKVMRTCPACIGQDIDADDYSVKSGKSASSRKSTRSTKSAKSKAKSGQATKSSRYGAMPFDGDGYCCRHPNVQLAKRKALGGFKIVHDVCPECAEEDGGSSRKKGGRNRSVSRDRRSRRDKSQTRGGKDDSSAGSSSEKKKKKRIRVRNLKTEDENGRHGRYSGYVNDDHRPHGQGVIVYEDGSEWEGVWSEGSQVHGKMKSASKGDGGGKAKSKF